MIAEFCTGIYSNHSWAVSTIFAKGGKMIKTWLKKCNFTNRLTVKSGILSGLEYEIIVSEKTTKATWYLKYFQTCLKKFRTFMLARPFPAWTRKKILVLKWRYYCALVMSSYFYTALLQLVFYTTYIYSKFDVVYIYKNLTFVSL